MLDPVTSRYAEALFSLAKKEDALDSVQGDVVLLARELDVAAVGAFFSDARIPLGDRRSRMQSVTKDMHRLTRNLIELLFDKRREEVLQGLGAAFHRRVLLDRGADEGIIESARPLKAPEIKKLAEALGKRLGKSLTLENRVIPEVLGGARVIVGSQMVDHSLSGRLDGMKKRMQAAALPSLTESSPV